MSLIINVERLAALESEVVEHRRRLAYRFYQRRREMRVSLREVSKHVGLSAPTLSKIERNLCFHRPSVAKLATWYELDAPRAKMTKVRAGRPRRAAA